MFKKISKLLVLAPLLMAFQCDDEVESTLVFNDYKINITPQSTFSVDDTVWIEGKVSAKAYDYAVNDSVFSTYNNSNTLLVYKFIEPTQVSNTKDAIDKFELVFDIGEYSFLPSCENAQMTANTELDADGLFYTYRIGLKAKEVGDYVISWRNAKIQNEDKNITIAENYPIANHPNQIGFNGCGNPSWLFIDQSKREYLFSVE